VHTDEVWPAETVPYALETIDLHLVRNRKPPLTVYTAVGIHLEREFEAKKCKSN
jgi:hypothetical protein